MKIKTPSSVLLACLTAIPCSAQTLPAFVNGQVPNLVETYKGIHAHPELSHHEEHRSALLADGAKAMLADHLYERFGTPDLAIALHDTNNRAAGTVSITSGAAMAASGSIDVTNEAQRHSERSEDGAHDARLQ